MPENVELRVDIIANGQAELAGITSSMAALDKQVSSGTLTLEQRIAAETKLNELMEKHAAVAKIVAAAEKSLAEQHEILHAGTEKVNEAFKEFGEAIHERVTEPLGSAYINVGKLAESFGPMASKVLLGAGALAGVAAISVEMVHSFAEASEATGLFAERMGISASQARQLELASRLAGVEAHTLEGATRTLSAALQDSEGQGKKASKALGQLGIDLFTSAGGAREMGAVSLELIDKLSKVESQTQRAFLAGQVFPRSAAKELQPLIENYQRVSEEMNKYGIAYDENVLKTGKEAEDQFKILGIAFGQFRDKLAIAITPIVVPILVEVTTILSKSPEKLLGLAGPALFPVLAENYFGGKIANSLANAIDAYAPDSHGLLTSSPLTFSGPTRGVPQVPPDTSLSGSVEAGRNFGKFLDTQGTGEEQLKRQNDTAQKNYQDEFTNAQNLQAQATRGNVTPGALDRERAKLQQLKALADAAKFKVDSIEASKKTNNFVLGLQNQAASPVDKIYNDLDAYLKNTPGLTSTDKSRATQAASDAAAEQFRILNEKGYDEQQKAAQEQTRRDIVGGKLGAEPIAEQLTGLERFDKSTTELAKQNFGANFTIDDIASSARRQKLIADSNQASKVAQLSTPLGGGPQAAEDTINQAYKIRLGLAEQIRDEDKQRATEQKTEAQQRIEDAKAEADFKKESDDAERDRALELLELKRKQSEEARALSGSVFDAITSHSPGTAVKDVFLGQAKDIGRSVFSNISQPLFESITGTSSILKSVGAQKKDGSSAENALWVKLAGGDANGAGGTSGSPGAPGSPTSFLRKILGLGGPSTSGTVAGVVPGWGSLSATGGDLGTYGSDVDGLTGQSLSDLPLHMQSITSLGPQLQSVAGGLANQAQTVLKGATMIAGAFGSGAGTALTGKAIPTIVDSFQNYDDGSSPTGADIAKGVGAGVGLAGAAYAGVTSAIHDFSKGGPQGITQGIGAIAGTAASFDPEPISHAVLAGIAGLATVVGAIFGDPKAERQAAINHELTNSQYSSTGYFDQKGNFVPGAKPASISYFGASGGQSYDYNFKGQIRGGSVADTTRNTFDPSPNSNQPGNIQQPLGDPTGGSVHNDNFNKTAPVVVQVMAMDSKSFLDHASDISSAVRKGIQMGHPVVSEIQQAVRPS